MTKSIFCQPCIVEGCHKDEDADEGDYIRQEIGGVFICCEHAEKGLRGERMKCKTGGYIELLVDVRTKEAQP